MILILILLFVVLFSHFYGDIALYFNLQRAKITDYSYLTNEIKILCNKSRYKYNNIVFVFNSKSKAFHSGIFGQGKVILKTSILNYNTDEAIAIIAHEIGHAKKRHNLIKTLFLCKFITAIYFVFSFELRNIIYCFVIVLVYYFFVKTLRFYQELSADAYSMEITGNNGINRVVRRLNKINRTFMNRYRIYMTND